MDIAGYTQRLVVRPAMMAWSADDKALPCQYAIEAALATIVKAYDFPFAIDETTEDTVASQAEYELDGENSDCREVIWIKYDGALYRMAWKSPKQRDEYLEGASSLSETVDFWTETGIKNGFPVITLTGTPSADGTEIKYSYRKKTVSAEEFPVEWLKELLDIAMDELFGSVELNSVVGQRLVKVADPRVIFNRAEHSLNEMIDNYRRLAGASEPPPMGLRWRSQNRRRIGKIGYG